MIYQSKWCFSIRASPNDLSPNDLPIQMIFQSEWFFSPNDFSVLMIFQSKWSQSKWSQSKQFPSPNDPSPVDPSPINPSLNYSGPIWQMQRQYGLLCEGNTYWKNPDSMFKSFTEIPQTEQHVIGTVNLLWLGQQKQPGKESRAIKRGFLGIALFYQQIII